MVFLMDSVDAVTLENSLMINEQLKKCICRIKVKDSEELDSFVLFSVMEKICQF